MPVLAVDFLPGEEIGRFGVEDETVEVEDEGADHGEWRVEIREWESRSIILDGHGRGG